MQNYKRTVYTTKLKKFCSVMEQAIVRSEVDNGPAQYWAKSSMIYNDSEDYDYASNLSANEAFWTKYLLPYMNNATISKGSADTSTPLLKITLADGAEFRNYNGVCLDMIYDINGNDTPPNSYGKDLFDFLLCTNLYHRERHFKDVKKVFGGYLYYGTREEALAGCKANPQTCSRLLEMDGCEFKKDYPYKLW